jgi:hypothetical protein
MKRHYMILRLVLGVAMTVIILDLVEGIMHIKEGWHLALHITANILAVVSLFVCWQKSTKPN